MKHQYAEKVPFVYDRNKLREITERIVREENLFNVPTPISWVKKEHRHALLDTLGIEYGSTIFSVNAKCVNIACLRPGQRSAIHKDIDFNQEFTTIALNVPVTECKQVIMNWYDVKPGRQIKEIVSARGWKIPGLSLHESVCKFTIQANKPFVVNPSYFHDVANLGNHPELIISIRDRARDTDEKYNV